VEINNMKAIVSNVIPFRKREEQETGIKIQRKDVPESQSTSQTRLQNPALFRTGKGFFKVDIENGIDYLIEAAKTKAGDVLGYLIKNMQFGNIAYVSPVTISRDTGIHLTHVSRYLAKLEGDGHIARYRTDSGAHAFLVSPAIGVKGNAQNERTAKAMWEALGKKRLTKGIRKQVKKTNGKEATNT
jgi:hypothetical protein